MAMAVSDTILSFVGFHASLLREDCTPRPEARSRAALQCAGSIAILGTMLERVRQVDLNWRGQVFGSAVN